MTLTDNRYGLDRLISADCADSFDQSWTLDGQGNFASFDDDGASQDRTVNAANEITGITGSWKDPQYDAAGNMIFGPKSGSETTGLHYIYDAWNLLVAVYEDDGDGAYEPTSGDTLIATYEYDGQKRRVEKTFADGSSTDFYYNLEWQLLEEREFDAESGPIESHVYVWSVRYIDAPILRDTHNDEGELQTSDRVYYAGDANNNVTALLDSTGTVIERYVYTAYGSVTFYDSAWVNTHPSSLISNPFLYCGYFFDAETGNYLARNRYYNTALAAWISRDSKEYDAGDLNLYRYVGNHATIYTDPFGYESWYGLTDTYNVTGDFNSLYMQLLTHKFNDLRGYAISRQEIGIRDKCDDDVITKVCDLGCPGGYIYLISRKCTYYAYVKPKGITIPKWTDRVNATPEQVNIWNTFIKYVIKHEQRHHEIGRRVILDWNKNHNNPEYHFGIGCTIKDAKDQIDKLQRIIRDRYYHDLESAFKSRQDTLDGFTPKYLEMLRDPSKAPIPLIPLK
jgi:RHS repeat-associated protein